MYTLKLASLLDNNEMDQEGEHNRMEYEADPGWRPLLRNLQADEWLGKGVLHDLVCQW